MSLFSIIRCIESSQSYDNIFEIQTEFFLNFILEFELEVLKYNYNEWNLLIISNQISWLKNLHK